MNQQSSIVNGPTTNTNENTEQDSFKQQDNNVTPPHHQYENNSPPQTPPQTFDNFAHYQPPQTFVQPQTFVPPHLTTNPQPQSPRPGLTRIDSRSNFPYRPPPFPNLPQGSPQIRPQNLRQPLPQATQPQFMVQRTPAPAGAQKPPLASSVPGYPQNPQIRPQNIRPLTPYPPRQPLQGGPQRPQIFQQRSVPPYTVARPPFSEDGLQRSQTLDSTEIENQKNAEETSRYSPTENGSRPASVVRNYSVSNLSEEKIEDKNEKFEKRQESVEVISRPESRAASRMNKIMEDEVSNIVSSADVPMKNYEPVFTEPVRNNEVEKMEEKVTAKIDREKPSLNLEKNPKYKPEGDNDSGVDESTQGNDQSSNGDARSPRKSSKSRTSSSTPTQGRSTSRNSKTPSLQSPDSNATTPGTTEKKKLPMNKVQVGAAPSPNLKVVRSKIGSLDNTSYKPGGGKVKIENKKIDFKSVTPRIEAKNDRYIPKGGEKKIPQQKLQWSAKSKIGSLDNSAYKPKGGDKKIETVKLDFKEKAKSKVGSKDNIKHQPGGGDVKIETKKIELHASSKVGSLDNMKHKPSGGDKKIFDDKDYLRQKSGKSSMDHSLSGSQNSIPSQPESKVPIADENLNQEH